MVKDPALSLLLALVTAVVWVRSLAQEILHSKKEKKKPKNCIALRPKKQELGPDGRSFTGIHQTHPRQFKETTEEKNKLSFPSVLLTKSTSFKHLKIRSYKCPDPLAT